MEKKKIQTGVTADPPRSRPIWRPWRKAKWGQMLAFGTGGATLILGLGRSFYEAQAPIKIGAILVTAGVALRAIDAWKPKGRG